MRAIRVAAAPSIAAAVLLLVVVGAAEAAPLKPSMIAGASEKLVPGLQRLAAPASRALSPAAQARALSLPAAGPGSMLRLGDKIVATARVSSTSASVVQAIAGAGAQVLAVSARYGTVTFAMPTTNLESVAAVPTVRSVQPELKPITSGPGSLSLGQSSGQADPTNAASCPWGSARSEGDTQLLAADARAAFGVDGSGVEMGVVSDSFDTNTSAATHAGDDVASGDLPGAGNPCGFVTPVQNLMDSPGGADEGRAMAQTIHDLAPRAPLAFASGQTAAGFPGAVSALQTAGAKVIADDLTFFNEPFFQDGPDAVAVDEAASAGVPYFSPATNTNVIVGGANVGSWEAPSFRETACPSGMPSGYAACMNFDPNGGTSNTEAITLGPGGGFKLDLQWNEPWNGVNTDLDAFVLSDTGAVLASSSNDNTGAIGTQQPFEFLAYTNATGANQTVHLAIGKWPTANAGNPRLKYVLLGASNILGVQFPTSSGGDVVGPTIFGHNGASGAMTIAAVPFDDSSSVESFSARGPVTHYYGPVTGMTSAAPLSSPLVLAKPDAAASDGAATTFYGQLTGGVWRFSGTSDSSAHAAAIAALQLQANPTATVSTVYGAERSTAAAVGSYGADAAGSGLLDAVGGVKAVLPPPSVSTGAASGVGVTSATVAGTVNPQGYQTGYRFEYGTTTAYGSSTPLGDAGAGSNDVPVSAGLSDLTASTAYHYRLVAVRDGAVVATGGDQTFTTAAPPPPVPSVSTGAASGVGVASASVAGTVNPQGYETGYRFEYGTTTAYGSSTPLGDAGAGSDDVPVSAALSDLTASTTYHYRLVAVRDGAVAATGGDQTLTTAAPPPPVPSVSTGAARGVGVASARVAGRVNPQGYHTGYWFEYGTTTAYGSSTPLGHAGAGSNDVPVSAALSDLTASTTYHYRLVAVRDGAVAATGGDQTLTTRPPVHGPPVGMSLPAITGTPTPGSVLMCWPGTWTAASIAYQWLRDGAPVPGAVASALMLRGGDLGHQIACMVTATNDGGAITAVSPATEVVVRLWLNLAPKRFKVATFGSSVVRGRSSGALVIYRFTAAANVRFSVERSQPGRHVRAHCQRQTSSNSTARRCTLWVALTGSFTLHGKLGVNEFRFSGRIGGHALAPGSYRLIATWLGRAGNRPNSAVAPFGIL